MDLAIYEALGRMRARRSRVRARSRFLDPIYMAASTTPKQKKQKEKKTKTKGTKAAVPNPRIGRQQQIVDIGPYIAGFYNVKNIHGRAVVVWKSAQMMRAYPLKREPCVQRA